MSTLLIWLFRKLQAVWIINQSNNIYNRIGGGLVFNGAQNWPQNKISSSGEVFSVKIKTSDLPWTASSAWASRVSLPLSAMQVKVPASASATSRISRIPPASSWNRPDLCKQGQGHSMDTVIPWTQPQPHPGSPGYPWPDCTHRDRVIPWTPPQHCGTQRSFNYTITSHTSVPRWKLSSTLSIPQEQLIFLHLQLHLFLIKCDPRYFVKSSQNWRKMKYFNHIIIKRHFADPAGMTYCLGSWGKYNRRDCAFPTQGQQCTLCNVQESNFCEKVSHPWEMKYFE